MTDGPLEFTVERSANPASDAVRAAMVADPGFGRYYTDHMVSVSYTVDQGWHDARVQPYGPIQLDPSAIVLHYAQEVFEGLKAYRHADGGIYTFRPEQNARRFNRSARRLSMPELPEEIFLQALSELIAADGDWVPSGADQTLYLRPFMFAKEAFLGVRPAKKYDFYVIGSPAGAYFTGGVTPVKIWLSENYARAAQGGTGAAKTGGNYASSLLPQAEAAEQGCDQVVFLDSRGNVEELGGMNVVFVKKDGTLVTPDSDSILDGVTRNSLLELAAARGHSIERRPVSLAEWREGVASGDIVEVFACGTAAIVTPIGELKAEGFVDEQPSGSLAHSLREELTDIQYGRAADRHGWLTKLG